MQDEETIRRRAYQIWVAEGRPEGRAAEHWDRACRELAAEAAALEHAPPEEVAAAADAAGERPAEAATPAAEPAQDIAPEPAAAPKRRRAKKS